MSGGNSGGYMPSIKNKFDCETGVIATLLSSIDIQVLSQHLAGETLIVALSQNSVVVENGDGEILGSVLHANVDELRECIENGNSYSAIIVSIMNTNCKVKISRD